MSNISRICRICKKTIDLESDEGAYVYSKELVNGYVHKQCFIDQKTGQKKNRWTFEECSEWLENADRVTKSRVNQRTLFDWILKTYDISYLPNHFYVKVSNIINGTYEKVSRPIPVEDIYDMWQRKIGYLNKVAGQNKDKGKVITGVNRVNYDLSILLSRYDSYLEWKIKKQEDDEKIKQAALKSKCAWTEPTKGQQATKMPGPSSEIDISKILDEI